MKILSEQILKFVWWGLICIGLSACKPFGKSFFPSEHLEKNVEVVKEDLISSSFEKITEVSNLVFPSKYLDQNSGMSLDFNNVTQSSPGDDVGMSYQCFFDRSVDGQVASIVNCSSLGGIASFHPKTGAFSWIPDRTVSGPFEIKVLGTKDNQSASSIFVVHVREPYSLTNLRANFDAYFASGIASASYGLDYWKDLTTQGWKATLIGDRSNWRGAFSYADVLRYRFDGSSYFSLGNGLVDNTQEIGINLWYNPENSSAKNKVILEAESNSQTSKIVVRQSLSVSGKVDVEVGDGNLYVKKVIENAPICYWRLSDTGATVSDVMGNCANGSFTGTVNKGQTGAFSNDVDTSVNFVGTGEISVPYSSSLDVGTGNFSVEAWIRSTNVADYQTIFCKDPPVLGNGIILYTLIGTGVMRSWVGGTANNWAGTVTDGNWHHVVLVRSSGNLYLYRDGVVQGPIAAAGNTNIAGSQVFMGRTTAGGYPYNGNIDDLAFYNYALSAAQVQSHYQAAQNTQAAICSSSNALTDQAWNFISVLFKFNQLQLFVNGAQKCAVTNSGIASNFATHSFSLGAEVDGSNAVTGSVSDLKISSNASNVGTNADVKSSFDVLSNRYRETPLYDFSTSNLVLYLDPANYLRGLSFGGIGCAISEFFDLSSNNYLATLTNFASCNTNSGFNGTGTTTDPYRLSFDGVNDHVAITNPPSFYSNQEFSISVWYRGTELGLSAPWGKGLVSWDNGSIFGGLVLSGGLAKFLHWDHTDGGWSNATLIQSTSSVANGQWHHIVFVNFSTETGDLYVDANKEISNVNSKMNWTVVSNRMPFVPGHIMSNFSNSYTSGEIGHVSVYNKAFTQSEVRTHCQALMARFGGSRCN